MPRFMLDTNAVSEIISQRGVRVRDRFRAHAISEICVSAVTYGETVFGLARRRDATRQREIAAAIYEQIHILPWTDLTAKVYGQLRADMEMVGRSLGALDMLIAAHALEAGATLVTNDRAFRHVPGLNVEDWTVA